MVMAQSTSPGAGMSLSAWEETLKAQQTMADRQAAIESLRDAWAKMKPNVQRTGKSFAKTGPMEYEAQTRESLDVLTTMLDILQLGYTVSTIYGDAGTLSIWTVTIYDPATMQEIAK